MTANKDIRAALKRVDDATCGACARCGEKNADGRLEARPHATQCIECARAE